MENVIALILSVLEQVTDVLSEFSNLAPSKEVN
jgi:hypothetical protein